MNLLSHLILATVLALSLPLAGCSKEEAAPAPADEPETTAPAAEVPAPKPTEPAPEPTAAAADEDGPAEAALAEYERVRAALSQDDIAAAVKAADALKEKASGAAAAASDAQRPHFEALAKAAEELAATSAEDAAAARQSFGEASRALVALLADAPELREGRHVFECPMAKSYKKWVQTDEELKNPYMGQKMLSCGGAAEWEQEGGAAS